MSCQNPFIHLIPSLLVTCVCVGREKKIAHSMLGGGKSLSTVCTHGQGSAGGKLKIQDINFMNQSCWVADKTINPPLFILSLPFTFHPMWPTTPKWGSLKVRWINTFACSWRICLSLQSSTGLGRSSILTHGFCLNGFYLSILVLNHYSHLVLYCLFLDRWQICAQFYYGTEMRRRKKKRKVVLELGNLYCAAFKATTMVPLPSCNENVD